MSFIETHPYYKSYNGDDNLHYNVVPYSAWAELQSLVDEAGDSERETLGKVVQKLATKTRYGNVEATFAYQCIPDVVSKLRKEVENGRFELFMDCLAILCDDGELSVNTINEYMENNDFGYRAVDGWNHKVVWDTVGIEKPENPPIYQISRREIVNNVIEQGKAQKAQRYRTEGHEPMRDSIFISHRTVDSEFADMILDFLVACEIPRDKIFCSSLPGNDVDEQISPEVKQRLKEASIIILILSKAYYESAYCVNEAGVAWYLDDVKSIPVGLPEINHNDMVGFLNSDYKLRRLDDDDDIAYLLEMAQERITGAGNIKPRIITREMQKLKLKYGACIEGKTLEEDSVALTEEDVVRSNNPVVQAIIDAGGKISNLSEIAARTGLSTSSVRHKIKQAIEDGEIESCGAGRHINYQVINISDAEAYTSIVGKDDVGNIPADSAFLLVYAAAGNGQIIKVQPLGSHTQVSADGKQFMSDMSQRESARWVEALDRLISWGWVKATGSRGQIYELTGTGYAKADWLKEGMDINTDNEPLDELQYFGG